MVLTVSICVGHHTPQEPAGGSLLWVPDVIAVTRQPGVL
jgi:hypothetical protein